MLAITWTERVATAFFLKQLLKKLVSLSCFRVNCISNTWPASMQHGATRLHLSPTGIPAASCPQTDPRGLSPRVSAIGCAEHHDPSTKRSLSQANKILFNLNYRRMSYNTTIYTYCNPTDFAQFGVSQLTSLWGNKIQSASQHCCLSETGFTYFVVMFLLLPAWFPFSSIPIESRI